ncbi:SEC-C domain-containing protein [Halobacillus sp. A1]|uniref:YecA family protein n=1 Tax=Halobacillus sp. A1 TaxID=2880262 RepID=UPI0020A68B5C|nr:SEC-C metal-binding domain-containing protein [Halobacillus sp. A1]MCP3031508.1 SEC-C domain-containing protein [Halobacillus sp. A1]
MAKVGRNDPCPCGSGKKYKKCHGQTNVIEFPSKRVEEELDQYFLQFQDFMYEEYPHVFPRSKPTTEEEEVEQFIKLLYKGLFEVQKGGATIFQQFLNKREGTILRSLTARTLRSWEQTKASIFKMINIDENGLIEVEDLLFGGTYKVDRKRIPLKEEDFNVAPYYTGILLNWGSFYKFAPMAVPIEITQYKKIRETLEKSFKVQSNFSTLSLYFHSTFLEQLPQWIFKEEEEINDSSEKEVLTILETTMESSLTNLDSYRQLIDMWVKYYQDRAPVIRKPAVFSAALEYFYKDSSHFNIAKEVSQKHIAEKYGVSTNSISKRYSEFEYFYSENKSLF